MMGGKLNNRRALGALIGTTSLESAHLPRSSRHAFGGEQHCTEQAIGSTEIFSLVPPRNRELVVPLAMVAGVLGLRAQPENGAREGYKRGFGQRVDSCVGVALWGNQTRGAAAGQRQLRKKISLSLCSASVWLSSRAGSSRRAGCLIELNARNGRRTLSSKANASRTRVPFTPSTAPGWNSRTPERRSRSMPRSSGDRRAA